MQEPQLSAISTRLVPSFHRYQSPDDQMVVPVVQELPSLLGNVWMWRQYHSVADASRSQLQQHYFEFVDADDGVVEYLCVRVAAYDETV